MGSLFMLINSCKKDDENNSADPVPITTVTDIDGNVYHTIIIGTQVWLLENLCVTHYRNGDPIPEVTDNTAWSNLTTGAYCNYDNDINNVTTYCRLYNWFAVNDSRKIAPVGWHVPSDAEWTTLTDYLGGESVAGGKLKEMGLTHWISPNTGATNESGFTGLPGGNRDNGGDFDNIGDNGGWWSSTEFSTSAAWNRRLQYNSGEVDRGSNSKGTAFSVRCLKD